MKNNSCMPYDFSMCDFNETDIPYETCDAEIKKQVICFLKKKDSFKLFAEEIESRVCGQPSLRPAIVNIYCYLKSISNGNIIKRNTLITAPSGSGKTEFFRSVQDILHREIPSLPIVSQDITSLSPAGYKGTTFSDVCSRLASFNSSYALVFLDEIDKACVAGSSDAGETKKDLQSNLLKFIEGDTAYFKSGKCEQSLDSSSFFILAAGSFDEIRRRKTPEKSKTVGFGSINSPFKEQPFVITREDAIEYGAIPELIGRFHTFVSMGELNFEAVQAITRKIKSKLEQEYGFAILIAEEAYKKIYEGFKTQKTGVRGIENQIRLSIESIEYEILLLELNPEAAFVAIGNDLSAILCPIQEIEDEY